MHMIEYFRKVKFIQNYEFLSAPNLALRLDISLNTWWRIQRSPESCSLKTSRKIKKFIDEWEAKNGKIVIEEVVDNITLGEIDMSVEH